MAPASALRQRFLDFFDHNGHLVCASTPVVPRGDPTLLFTSAGMVPFKAYFLGVKSGLSRTASCQKCVRTTDIDRVGGTVRHLTFFEMLGNFSFGDYFKADAIAWAWEFLTKELGLDPRRLHPSVFKDDPEALELWRKLGVPNAPVLLGEDSNFWNMGPTGPCGPCSEIYFDSGEANGCGGPACGPGCDCDRYIELWNLVFTQFDRQENGSLRPLPQKNIDTGMGLERLAMAVQGHASPFDTDLFSPVTAAASDILKARPDQSPEARLAFRVISDHARAAAVLAAEGIIPSNVERGYVLRRLIRRAVRYGKLLGRGEPFLHRLAAPVLSVLGEPYPEFSKAQAQIEYTLRAEEQRFFNTLERGEAVLAELLAAGPKALSGEEAFKLYDTFGFPFELTKEICASSGVAVDEDGYAAAQRKAAAVARAGWKGTGERAAVEYEKVLAANPGLRSDFAGYRATEVDTRVIWVFAYRDQAAGEAGQAPASQELLPGDDGEIILQRTPFYPESGGQVGDKGVIFDDVGNKVAEVHDTRRPHPAFVVHRATALRLIRAGLKVKACVDPELREHTAYHHTATHLLNEALRRVLGPTVRQAGSFVAADRLRFDFTWDKPLSPDELRRVEELVNSAIAADIPVEVAERPASDIEVLKPVTLLGEDYGERPRFVLVGEKGWADPSARFSLELCGGTHVHRTGVIRHFKIRKESSVAAGIRRIEAVAGPAYEEHQRLEDEKARQDLRDALIRYLQITAEIMAMTGKPFKAVPRRLPDPDVAPVQDIKRALEALKELEKMLVAELGNLKQAALTQQAHLGKVFLDVGGYKLSVQKFREAEPTTLRSIADDAKRELGTGVVLLGSTDENKLSFVVGVTRDLAEKGVDALAIARAIAVEIGGRAGGRSDFAQGGGPDTDWELVVRKVTDKLRSA